jgi:hypothetical protein
MTHPQVLSDEQAPDFLTDTEVARIFRNVYGGQQYDSTERMFAAEIEAAVRAKFARAIESATLKAVSGQEPIGYFRSMPFGWEDCAETDDGAMPLYELPPAQPAPAMAPSAVELMAEKYANHDFCSDYLSTITSIVREVESRVALQCAQAPQPTKGQP